MLAAWAERPDPADPLSALRVGARPEPVAPAGWVTVEMRAASLNMHDVSTLSGIRTAPEVYPIVLGCDGAGVLADGTGVVVHPCVNAADWHGPQTLDPARTVLSELHPGTFAEYAVVPAGNVLPKPASLSFGEAACMGTAWLTAYRMVFVRAGLRPGMDALVLGRRGSINGAAIALGTVAGIGMWVMAPDGAITPSTGGTARAVPTAFDAVLDAGVDEAQWSRYLRALRPGGAVVCAGYRSGATDTGYALDALHQLIFGELRLVGCAMGTTGDLTGLLSFLDRTGLRPEIGLTLPLAEVADGIGAMLSHRVPGKIVFSME